jgi:hypothetical protein
MVNLTLMVKLTGLKYAHTDCTDAETRFGPILQKRFGRTHGLDKQADTAAFECGQSLLISQFSQYFCPVVQAFIDCIATICIVRTGAR